jgi:hypothetical protein
MRVINPVHTFTNTVTSLPNVLVRVSPNCTSFCPSGMKFINIEYWNLLVSPHDFTVSQRQFLKSSMFPDITLWNLVKVSTPFGGIRQLHLQSLSMLNNCFMLVSCLAYSLAPKMEATFSSETLVDFRWITRLYVLGDTTLRLLIPIF